VAVCLQALAAAGLLPRCWEGTGYDTAAVRGEEGQAGGGTGCLAVPLGCRQLVALLPQETKDKVRWGPCKAMHCWGLSMDLFLGTLQRHPGLLYDIQT
jgi:hypothetical protein